MNPNHLIIINANIITCDPLYPRAEALSVCGSRIDEVGTNSSILGTACPQTVILDLHEKTVTPGFIDAHLHPAAIYPDLHHKMHVVDLFDIKSIDELIALLAERAEFVPAGEWVTGRGY